MMEFLGPNSLCLEPNEVTWITTLYHLSPLNISFLTATIRQSSSLGRSPHLTVEKHDLPFVFLVSCYENASQIPQFLALPTVLIQASKHDYLSELLYLLFVRFLHFSMFALGSRLQAWLLTPFEVTHEELHQLRTSLSSYFDPTGTRQLRNLKDLIYQVFREKIQECVLNEAQTIDVLQQLRVQAVKTESIKNQFKSMVSIPLVLMYWPKIIHCSQENTKLMIPFYVETCTDVLDCPKYVLNEIPLTELNEYQPLSLPLRYDEPSYKLVCNVEVKVSNTTCSLDRRPFFQIHQDEVKRISLELGDCSRAFEELHIDINIKSVNTNESVDFPHLLDSIQEKTIMIGKSKITIPIIHDIGEKDDNGQFLDKTSQESLMRLLKRILK